MNLRIETAIKIVREMMEDRGMAFVKQEDLILEFVKDDEKCGVFLCPGKFNKDQYKIYNKYIVLNDITHCIILYDEITSNVKWLIDNKTFEGFEMNKLQFNITKHYLVPKHEKVDIKFKDNLSIILVTDPIARYFNFQPGDIIRITRKDSIDYKIIK